MERTFEHALAKLNDACEDGLAQREEGVEYVQDRLEERGEDGPD